MFMHNVPLVCASCATAAKLLHNLFHSYNACHCTPMQGALRVNRYNPYEGYVGSDSVGQDILLAGRTHMNRAMDGESNHPLSFACETWGVPVAVELLPE